MKTICDSANRGR